MKKPKTIPQNIYSPQYNEKKSLFSEKEIILRSSGRATVFRISSKVQCIFWCLFLLIGAWNFYSYHVYNKSGRIIHHKDMELLETRDAYAELMSDFMAINKNINNVIASIGQKGSRSEKEVDIYKRQAMVVEDKIKEITAQKEWLDTNKVSEKAQLNEAILQRDIAASERDELRKQLRELETNLKEIKAAEIEVFNKVEAIASREIQKIKSLFVKVNEPLKKKGLYFNPLANSRKKDSYGGPFIPVSSSKLMDKEDKIINDKISGIYNKVDDLQYYREVIKGVPVGKPVWSYWVTSPFGHRSDPFNKKKAAHKGVDLASRTGNKIKIMAEGKVIKVEYSNKGYGNLVVVDHGNGFQSKYAHLNKIYVKKGDHLAINDTLGEVGSTGRSTGPHLHYEILYKGQNVDPMPFIQAKL